MTKLTVLAHPDPRLRTKAKPVEAFNVELAQLIDDMFETMYADNGVGLAATQVNVHLQILVADTKEDGTKQPFYLINPKLLEKEGEVRSPEGCLSVPGIYADVKRAEKIKISYQDKEGNAHELIAEGFMAIVIQHEMDHLVGRLFIDYLSAAKREKVRKLLAKMKKNP